MGRVQDDEATDALGVRGGEPPGDDPAPIVPDHLNLLGAEMVRQRQDIVGEPVEVIGREKPRLAAPIVSALIGDDDTQS